jgi:hypothetical protein
VRERARERERERESEREGERDTEGVKEKRVGNQLNKLSINFV